VPEPAAFEFREKGPEEELSVHWVGLHRRSGTLDERLLFIRELVRDRLFKGELKIGSKHRFVLVSVRKLRTGRKSFEGLDQVRFVCRYSPREANAPPPPMLDSHSSVWPDPGVVDWPRERLDAFRHAVATFLADCAETETHLVRP